MSNDDMSNDEVWAAFEAAGEHNHGELNDVAEGQMLLLQSKAVSTLAAMAGGQMSMVMAQLDELWALSCMEKVFCMATWCQVAGKAAHAVGAEMSLVMGDSEGNPKTDPTEEDKLAESFMNLMISSEVETIEPAIDAMHDYLHEATDVQARGVFVTVLGATASATRACMAKANGTDDPRLREF